MPFFSRKTRWALTPPFHPYLPCGRRFFFCCTFRKNALRRSSRPLAGLLSSGVRTFLTPGFPGRATIRCAPGLKKSFRPYFCHSFAPLRSRREKNPAVESHAEAAEPAEGEGWYVLKRLLCALCALGVKKIRKKDLTRRPQSPQRDMGWNDAQGNLRALSALCVKKNPAVESHAETAERAEGRGMVC